MLWLGLLGEKIAYSFSPQIFDWIFRRSGVEGRYPLYDVPAAEARARIVGESWDGLNVTVPHKSLAHGLCSQRTYRADLSAAVNTLCRGHGEVCGDNTDVSGAEFAVAGLMKGVRTVDRSLVVGSGGAARAALVALARSFDVHHLTVVSRDPPAVPGALQPLLQRFPQARVCGREAAEELSTFDLVIQATPVGSSRNAGLPLPPPLRFKPDAAVLDMIYAPLRTAFLEIAERSGVPTQNGLIMLIAQAISSFEVWTGIAVPVDEAVRELLPRLSTS